MIVCYRDRFELKSGFLADIPNGYKEYKADDQQISFNVRNGESSHFEVSLIWPEDAQSGRNVAVQQTPVLGHNWSFVTLSIPMPTDV
jgi:hypothetical protein